ncbi:hypothetical protein [Rhizobium leguminosarum]
MQRRRQQEFDGWLRANVPEPDYKRHKGWRRLLWRIADFFDGWYGF